MNMKPTQYLLLFFLFLAQMASAQSANQMTSAQDSDPAAKALLDKMRQKYENYQTMKAEFRLALAFPDQPVENQNISVLQNGEQYRVDMPDRTLISDGQSLWMIQHSNKEVQITNVPEAGADAGIMSPQSLFRIYESNEFVYVLANESVEDGVPIQQIEFKPLDEFSDYSKLRLTLAKKDASFLRMKAFGKDGTRFSLFLERAQPNTSLPSGAFTFSKADYPDYYIEDLR